MRTAPSGRHTDGGGLYLQVDKSGARRWLLRLTVRGKRCDYGLGSAKVLPLVEARERAIEMRKVVLRGGNPKVRQREEDGKHLTFEDLSRRVHERKFKENKSNGKHIAQWITTLETYAFPVLGKMSVEDVSQIEIEEVLDPIWTVKPETARRILQRITTVFDHACGMGYRTKGKVAQTLLDRRAVVILAALRCIQPFVPNAFELAQHLRDVVLSVAREVPKRGVRATNSAPCCSSPDGKLREHREGLVCPCLPTLDIAPSLAEKLFHKGGFGAALSQVRTRCPLSQAYQQGGLVG